MVPSATAAVLVQHCYKVGEMACITEVWQRASLKYDGGKRHLPQNIQHISSCRCWLASCTLRALLNTTVVQQLIVPSVVLQPAAAAVNQLSRLSSVGLHNTMRR